MQMFMPGVASMGLSACKICLKTIVTARCTFAGFETNRGSGDLAGGNNGYI